MCRGRVLQGLVLLVLMVGLLYVLAAHPSGMASALLIGLPLVVATLFQLFGKR